MTAAAPSLAAQLEWPGEFRLHDPDPTDHHSALFLVFPDGLMVNISCHAAEGMDRRRGEWITKTLNDELRKIR